MEHVAVGELHRLWIVGCPDSRCRLLEIEWRPPERDALVQHEPVRARLTERHADAAGVDDTDSADPSIELHVRVSADDNGRVDAGEDRTEAVVRREAREDFGVVAWGRMAEQHVA